MGCFGFAGFNLLHYHTLHYTSVINASLIQTAIPMMVLLLNRSLFKQTPMLTQILALLLALLGVALLLTSEHLGKLKNLTFNRGDLLTDRLFDVIRSI